MRINWTMTCENKNRLKLSDAWCKNRQDLSDISCKMDT